MWRTLSSEWGKTWSVRAPWACLAATALLVAVTALSLANDFVHGTGTGERPPGATMAVVDAVGPALQLGQVAFAAFALQLVTVEHATGSIRATLQAQPRRHLVLVSKAVVAATCGAVAGAVLGAVSAWGSRLALGTHVAAGGPSLLGVAARSAVLLTLVAVLVVGLGAVLRSAVGTLTASTVLLLATLALPEGIGRWAPGQAGVALVDAGSAQCSTAVGLLVLAAWAGAALAAGLWLMERRDA